MFISLLQNFGVCLPAFHHEIAILILVCWWRLLILDFCFKQIYAVFFIFSLHKLTLGIFVWHFQYLKNEASNTPSTQCRKWIFCCHDEWLHSQRDFSLWMSIQRPDRKWNFVYTTHDVEKSSATYTAPENNIANYCFFFV